MAKAKSNAKSTKTSKTTKKTKPSTRATKTAAKAPRVTKEFVSKVTQKEEVTKICVSSKLYMPGLTIAWVAEALPYVAAMILRNIGSADFVENALIFCFWITAALYVVALGCSFKRRATWPFIIMLAFTPLVSYFSEGWLPSEVTPYFMLALLIVQILAQIIVYLRTRHTA